MDEEIRDEELGDLSIKNVDIGQDVEEPEEDAYETDPNEEMYSKAFPKEEDSLFAQDDDAKEIFDIFAQEYDER